MYSVSLLLLCLSVQTGLTSYVSQCNYLFQEKYPKSEVENDSIIIGHNSSFINYCTAEDVPYDVQFYVWSDGIRGGYYNDYIRVEFEPPKRECSYGVALLVNPSIKNEEECKEYNFENVDDIKSKTHTVERNVCFFKNTSQSILTRYQDNELTSLIEDNIWIPFRYIFTGCYVLRFHIDNQKYVMGEPVFLKTTYKPVEVQEPQVICRYKEQSNLEKRQVKNFTLDAFLPGDTGEFLRMDLISPRDKDLKQSCTWRGEPLLYTWTINLRVSISENERTDEHCNVKLVKPSVNGKDVKRVRCNFQTEVQSESHCFIYQLFDERCQADTIWKPEHVMAMEPCVWLQRCVKTYDHWLDVATIPRKMKSDNVLSANSYLLLPIIAIVLIVSAVTGVLCSWYLCVRKIKVNLYASPQHDDSDCPKSTDFGIIDNISEKEIDRNNPSCNDIVLLYTNNSTSFMTLMKDFRETLVKMCSCSVHDWHNGVVWNEVAKVGAVSWFTKLLNNGCRVIWIDTLVTRSIIMSNSRDNESNFDKPSKYYEIHDFRDVAFRVVLQVAKSQVDDVACQYRRHFVVRFEGLESTTNVNDPFLDLCPHARYYMPQHFMQLCSDISLVKTKISKHKKKVEEDLSLYRIFVYQLYKFQTQQRLKFMKVESTI